MQLPETSEEKKAFVLLNSIIFHYHGLDEEEALTLEAIAEKYSAEEELKWSFAFISEDYLTAFERAREYLKEVVNKLDKSKRLFFISEAWQANYDKGYITEMEATAMLQLAKDWEVDSDLITMVQEVS